MTLQQLEYVVALVRFGHFARAADFCGITQPTLSTMVQKLEEELGTRLFVRGSRPVVPTEAGRLVAAQAHEVLTAAGRLRHVVEEEKQSLSGTFRIGVLPTVAPYLIPRFFPHLCTAHPEARLQVVEMKTADMKMALAQGDIDAGLLARVPEVEELCCHTLYYERFLCYVAEQSPLSAQRVVRVADLKGERLWMLDEGHCFRDQLVKYCRLKAAAHSQQAYRLGSIETFMHIVEGGLGVTFIPELALSQLSERQRALVRPFALPAPTREIVLATMPDFLRAKWVSLLCTTIRQRVPADMLSLTTAMVRL